MSVDENRSIRLRRKRAPGFVMVDNAVVRNPALTFEARGLFAMLLSLPDDWEFRFAWLCRQGRTARAEGHVPRDTMRRILRELNEHGYVTRRKVRDGDSGQWRWEWTLDETPGAGNPSVANPSTDDPSAADPSTDDTAIYEEGLDLDLVNEDLPDAEVGRSADADAVWSMWVEVMAKNGNTVRDDKRDRRIRWALRHYALDEVLDAVRGCAGSDFHMGRGQYRGGTRYDDLTLILRDAEHVERFRDAHRAGGVSERDRILAELRERRTG